jgi:hypothetical protein
VTVALTIVVVEVVGISVDVVLEVVDETVVVVVEFEVTCPMLKESCFWLFCSLSSAI